MKTTIRKAWWVTLAVCLLTMVAPSLQAAPSANDPADSPVTPLDTGTSPEIAVEDASGADLTSGVSSVSFGSADLGVAQSLTLIIRNTGTSPLTGVVASLSGGQASDFAMTTLPSPTLSPVGSTTVTVRFTPSALGSRTTTLRIASNDADENPFDLTLSGTGTAAEIAVEDAGGADLTSGVSGVSFGLTDLGAAQSLTLIIRNTGTSPLTGVDVSLSGGQLSDFVITDLPSSTVNPGGSTAVTVRFTPSALGPLTTTLRIASNDADENPFDLTLSGAGSAAEITVDDAGGADLTSGVSDVSFGLTDLGAAQSLTLTIRNTGTSPLTGVDASLSGEQVSDFVITDLPSSTVSPGSSTAVTVRFTPSALGSRTTALRIASNDADENPFDLTLSGTGSAPEVAVEDAGGADLTSGVSTVSFGSADLGVAPSRTLTIRNTGTSPLTGVDASLSGGQATDFVITGLPSSIVSPGSSTTVTVRFTPTALGSRTTTLRIASNDADENPFDLALSGFGSAPEIAVEDAEGTDLTSGVSSVSFGSADNGESQARTLTIRNTGTSSLTGVAASLSGGQATDFTLTTLPAPSFGPAGATTVTVRFTPTALGPRSTTLRIASNDPDENPFELTLTGFGSAPEIAVEDAEGTNLTSGVSSVPFGSADRGETQLRTLTIRNTGTSTLTGVAASLSGGQATDFVITALPATSVSPGETTTVSLRFSPTALGPLTTTLRIASNDADENPFDMTLSGFGSAPEIAVEYPIGTDLTSGVSSVPFGSVNTGATLLRTVTIRNIGTSMLTGVTASLSGGEESDFTITSPPATSVSPGGSTTVSVRLSPTALGPLTTTLLIASNDADEDLFDLTLSGTGSTPEIGVEYPAGTDLTGGVSIVSFGSVNVGATRTRNITIRNTGTGPLTGVVASLNGGNVSDFVVTRAPGSNVSAGGSTTVSVRLAPSVIGPRTTTLRIASNDTDENPFELTLSGTGLAPEIEVEYPAGTNLTSGLSTVPFGSVLIGTFQTRTITIRNAGNASLTGLTASLNGGETAAFSVINAPASTLAADKTATISVRFTAFNIGSHSTTLRLESNDADENPFEVRLTGTGVEVLGDTYENWAAGYGLQGPDASPQGSPNGDGVSNLLKYASNLGPRDRAVELIPGTGKAGLPVIRLDTSRSPAALTVEYLRRRTDPGIFYRVEFSDGLGSPEAWSEGTPVVETTIIDDSWERVIVRDVPKQPASPRRFARVVVEMR